MSNSEEDLSNEQNNKNASVSEDTNTNDNIETELLKAQLEAENAVKKAVLNISKIINS
ncbi:hypothetical protein [Polaribacter sp. SA4-12]|uniref:hypothetical protein n=1 Tax=Polaribacter sp. SA4-12 TaxID=1312072 RepID=UPI0012F80974|nr:hypothetical protein [Polaribacter sp. SA4-12]